VIAERAINIVRERLEREDMPPKVGACYTEDAERGETEAMPCMLGRLAAAEDADTAVRVFGEEVRDEAWVGTE
jgi:hypothetical protein